AGSLAPGALLSPKRGLAQTSFPWYTRPMSHLAGVRRSLLLGALLASLALVAPASSSVRIERPTHVGGTLQVYGTGTDLASLHPPVNYATDGAQILYHTCAKLVNPPDAAGPGGAVLEPEIAAAMPTVSAGGRVYTFRISHGFTFSNGRPLEAADVAYTFRRLL